MDLGPVETLNRFRFMLIFLVAAILTVAAGGIYWTQKKADFLRSAYSRKSFELLDDENKIYGTKNLRQDELLLLIFTADAVNDMAVKKLSLFEKDLPKLATRRIQVALVSRMNRDIMASAKYAAHYTGRVLSDPSGSLGKIIGAWPDNSLVRFWSYALVTKDLRILWTARSDTPLEFKEFSADLDKLK